MTERETPSVDGLVVGILGGTGDQGRGLARRFALAGHPVVLGSRQAEKAQQAAAQLRETVPDPELVSGATNADAAAKGDVVVVAVPWSGHEALIKGLVEELAGKVVVDCV